MKNRFDNFDIEVVSSSFDTVDVGEDGDFAVVYKPVIEFNGEKEELWLDINTTIAAGISIPAYLGDDVNLDGSHEIVVLANDDNAMTIHDNEAIVQAGMDAVDYIGSKYGEVYDEEELYNNYYEKVEEVIKRDLQKINLKFVENSKQDEFGISHSRLSKDKILGYVSEFKAEEPEQKQEKKQKKSKGFDLSM